MHRLLRMADRIYSEAQLTAHVETILKRVAALEAHAAAVGEKVGVPFEDPSSKVPPEVVEMARAGDRMGAIKKYRELTGADVAEAQGVVASL
jgi:ribosomal protein L7/L12